MGIKEVLFGAPGVLEGELRVVHLPQGDWSAAVQLYPVRKPEEKPDGGRPLATSLLGALDLRSIMDKSAPPLPFRAERKRGLYAPLVQLCVFSPPPHATTSMRCWFPLQQAVQIKAGTTTQIVLSVDWYAPALDIGPDGRLAPRS